MKTDDEKRRVAQRVHELAEHGAEVLMDLIRFPSVCGQEMEAVRHMKATLEAAGLPPRIVPMDLRTKEHAEYTAYEKEPPWEGRGNLVAEYGGAGKGRSLILNGHLDVVPAESWPGAFEPKRDGDVIAGRGAADAKGGVVATYLAARALVDCDVEVGGRLSLHHVIDEETGGNGTLTLLDNGHTADAAIVAECTDNVICPANRGAVWFKLITTGKATHMGTIDEGVSAIDMAHRAV
ncbi:MAG: M20/M25/M40 family metallo-hydrolase, partial [bacterium]|nr:M20/M25/M40 family metallo-hydrolase [bacterium]